MIQVTPGFKEKAKSTEFISFPGLAGGVRIMVDGKVVTKFAEEVVAEPSWNTANDPIGDTREAPADEFVGRDISASLGSLFHAFEPFVSGEAERHQEYVGELYDEPSHMLIAFSHLDGEYIRIAALPKHPGKSLNPALYAQLGVAIEPTEFAAALADCYEECLEYIHHAFVETDRDNYRPEYVEEIEEDFNHKIERLRSMIAE